MSATSSPSNTACPFVAHLYFKDGKSDKVYAVRVEPSGEGYVTNFAFGRRGAALTTGSKTPAPVSLDKAIAIATKLVHDKRSNGYTDAESGERYANSDKADRVTGYLPQLLNPIAEEEVAALVSCHLHVAQEKVDGERVLAIVQGGTLTVANRSGLSIGYPEKWNALAAYENDLVIDGEQIGTELHAFDLLVDRDDVRELPFVTRFERLLNIIDSLANPDWLRPVHVARSPADKQQLLDRIRTESREGIVFRRSLAPYRPGRPNSGGDALKFKLVESASCVVSAVNTGKRSVAIALFDDAGRAVNMGNCTIPASHPVPQEGAVVEVRYLYRSGPQGALFQPVFLGERRDIPVSEAKLAQVTRVKVAANDDSEALGQAVEGTTLAQQ